MASKASSRITIDTLLIAALIGAVIIAVVVGISPKPEVPHAVAVISSPANYQRETWPTEAQAHEACAPVLPVAIAGPASAPPRWGCASESHVSSN